jgi:predicted acyltransferase
MEQTKRLLSLDVFRGLTIALMIVVNNPGSWDFVYPPLLHSKWNGCTPTDMVFPFFMFIIGAAMWYSYKKYNYTLTGNLAIKILRRTFLIYIIGLAINAYSTFTLDVSHIRIMGVLARIALGYCIASFLVLGLKSNRLLITGGLILLAYWGILLVFGGDSPYTLEGNFVRSFDISVLGINHVPVFQGVKFDQTGLLSTLPSIANVLFGYLAGKMIDTSENKVNAAVKLIFYGIAGIVLAKVWGLLLPINKPLWTSSFVLYTCGFASVFLGILLWITDIKGFTKWTRPFQVFGMNSIFIYVVAEFLAISFWIKISQSPAGEDISINQRIYESIFQPLAGNFNGSLLYALTFACICWFTGWILFRRKIFIKL